MPEAKQIEEDVVEVEFESDTEKDIEGTQVSVGEEREEGTVEETSDEDLEGYSDKVKKRIEKLTYKMREAERREKAATEYAQSVQKQNEELAKRSSQIDESYISEYDQRVTSQEDGLKKKLSDAINLGDVDAQIEAQKSIAKLAIESERPMTLTAFSIHKSLVENEYFDPSSDEYYQELDKRIREEFPHKFQQGNRSSVRAPVAGATRSSGKPSNKKIKLSPSQVAIADKLGVSYEQYAKQLARLQS